MSILSPLPPRRLRLALPRAVAPIASVVKVRPADRTGRGRCARRVARRSGGSHSSPSRAGRHRGEDRPPLAPTVAPSHGSGPAGADGETSGAVGQAAAASSSVPRFAARQSWCSSPIPLPMPALTEALLVDPRGPDLDHPSRSGRITLSGLLLYPPPDSCRPVTARYAPRSQPVSAFADWRAASVVRLVRLLFWCSRPPAGICRVPPTPVLSRSKKPPSSSRVARAAPTPSCWCRLRCPFRGSGRKPSPWPRGPRGREGLEMHSPCIAFRPSW